MLLIGEEFLKLSYGLNIKYDKHRNEMKRCYVGENGSVWEELLQVSFKGLQCLRVVDNIPDVCNSLNVYCLLFMREEMFKVR